MGKTVVCRCEDVIIEDLKDAFENGFHDIESIKRYTGFGTGFCQGKGCIAHVSRFLAKLRGGDDVLSDPIRTRPLLHPTPVSRFVDLVEPDEPTDSAPKEKESE
jgi:sarcosine oxidase subunit beta